MRRRDVLRVGGWATVGAVGAALTGEAAAHPTPDGAGTERAGGGAAHVEGGFEPLGRLPLAGAKELVVDGDVAYVAATDGFATVDVSDPADPTLLAERRGLLADLPDGPLEMVYDGKAGGDYYAVGAPGRERDGALNAVAVYDVSDPADPERVLARETEFHHHNLDVDGGTLYLCGNDGDRNPLVCVDVDSGEELGRWSVVDADGRWGDVDPQLRELHDVWVEDGVAHCAYWNAGTWLVDVGDPTDPSPLTSLRGLDPDEQAAIDGEEALRGARFGLPGNDHFVRPWRAAPGATGAAESTDGLVALNEEAWGLEADAPASDLGGVELWDVERGERLGRVEAPPTEDATHGGVWTTSHNFAFVGDYLYTSWYRGGVKLHDASDPTAPRAVAHWRDDATTDFWTAQRADGCVVASSWRDHSREDPVANAAVYTFPTPDDLDSSDGGSHTTDDSNSTDDGTGAPTGGAGAGPGLFAGGTALGAAAALARRLL
jgi:hypothetical protein